MSIVVGADATHSGLPHVPPGYRQLAGYSTEVGTGAGIEWTGEDWAAHPGAIRICQDPGLTDDTADVADLERGAGTIADAPGWYRRASASYHAGKRPGQRWPAFYASQDNITPLVNHLIASGIPSGPGLIIANWSISEGQAAHEVLDAGGPFPVKGMQFQSFANYDVDLWSESWLAVVSKVPPHLVSAELVAKFSDGTVRTYAA